VEIDLAEQDRPSIRQTPGNSAVSCRHPVSEIKAPARCSNAFCIDVVLERDRDSVKRTPITASLKFVRGALRFSKGTFGGNGDERVDAWIQRFDGAKMCLRYLGRRKLS
jgi:hypothetical protein